MWLPICTVQHLIVLLLVAKATRCQCQSNEEDPAVTRLREYVRINTAHPNPDYEPAIEWFRKQATENFGLKFNLVRFTPPNLFAVWLTLEGTNPDLKAVFLNSHMDTVSVNREKWTHDPFSAFKDSNGTIYGRGIADMKSYTIARLEALKRLKQEGLKPLRSIHVAIIPDEEIGGEHGMKAFVNSQAFKQLNIGVDIDEGGGGILQENGKVRIGIPYAQKSAWQFNVTAEGVTGHGASAVPNGTAGQKIQHVISRLMEKRASEIKILDGQKITEANITSINLVQLGGGIGNNILPPLLWAAFDMRIRPLPFGTWNFTDAEKFLDTVCKEAGDGVSYTFSQKGMFFAETRVDNTNIWWKTLTDTCVKMNWECLPVVATPTSDAGYVRDAGISALGFGGNFGRYGPVVGIHGDNEAINERDFLETIDRYKALIKDLSMVSDAFP